MVEQITNQLIPAPKKKEGYARKYKNFLKSYQKRYFVLEGDILAYFKNTDMASQALRNRESVVDGSEFEARSTLKSSMAQSLRGDQVTKKSYEGGLISLRLSEFNF